MKEKIFILKQVLIKYAEQIDILINDYNDETNDSDQYYLWNFMNNLPCYIREAVEEILK